MNLLEEGIARKLIVVSDDRKKIQYPHCNKSYSFTNPEERVRAEAYLELVINYDYPVKRLDVELPVQIGSQETRADVVVFEDDTRKKPYIVVECKAASVTEAEFVTAVNQGFSYAVSLGCLYAWITSDVKQKTFIVRGYGSQERDANSIAALPRYGQDKLSRAKYYKGGRDENGGKAFDLELVAQDKLTGIFKKAHQALWGGGKRNPSEAFDELDKLIFCKLWDEKRPYTLGQPYAFQEFSGETPLELKTRIDNIYKEGQTKDPEVFRDPLRLTAPELKTVLGYLTPLNIGDSDLDSKGRAFETFLGSFFRGDFGQYFTPREVVEFIVDSLPFDHRSRVLDTSCGSGGFLLYALDKVRHQANELAKAGAFKLDSAKHYAHWHDFASKNLYGIEISEGIARTAKMNMIIHDDGHTNVVTADGLLDPEDIARVSGNAGFQRNSFDVILTNPPFGSVVKQTERAYLANYKLGGKEADWITQLLTQKFETGTRDSQSTEVLFLEQCWRFLRPGGWLAVVVPDGLLTNSSTQGVRDWLEEHYRLAAVVSLPQDAFRATNAGVKSSVLILRKLGEAETEQRQAVKRDARSYLFKKGKYDQKIEALEAAKKAALRRRDGFDPAAINWESAANALLAEGGVPEPPYSPSAWKVLEKTSEYRAWKAALSADFNEQIKEVKESLREEVQDELRAKMEAHNYQVLMALPEQIGFDGTGRKTPQNDLKTVVGPDLKKFLQAIADGKDGFFR
ncbi:restriction endonuclease subunit M [Microvirga sp. STS02]|uniref:restriction endonuclease subunit M n=1 Tax=Hymenobacter negativus TaxID=2795026 RepID=UPI0018DC11DC|nr:MULTISPECIES: N-6 DNA methylase [Bacteria]MBH8570013.1 restriction endonuclease subunit M [Hymenobacter negativus]MBR7209752.1 restriction endonuclease subunit M [Microvirga sp. STS02]